MNYIFTTIGSCALWVLFKWFHENPQSTVIATVILAVAGIVGVLAFRMLFDFLFPDQPCDSRYLFDDNDE